ncbi:ESX secretion-associated protein EspG [Nocardia sp. NPDC057353]|uniref:ESX secretion-associated protein EspG n=1 Tax=Nocardia sp. NPDC057353 TaxID=3346104 RepID=UPI00363F4E32
MTGAAWRLTDLQFQVLCDEFRRGSLPAPFSFVSRIASARVYDAECARLRGLIRASTDAAFLTMTATLRRPDVFVVARSWQDFAYADSTRHIRLHGILKGDDAYLMSQLPGETVEHSGGFDIVRHDRADLVAAVFARFPAIGAGAGEPIPAAYHDRSPFLEGPAVASGFIKVLSGARDADGTRREVGYMWRDLPGDGRYTLPLHRPEPAARPMGSTELAAWAEEQIAAVYARL